MTLVEYSLYSYINDTSKIVDNLSLNPIKYTEIVYKAKNQIVIIKKLQNEIFITKNVFVDKNKNRKYLCMKTDSCKIPYSENQMADVECLLVNLDYKKTTENKIVGYQNNTNEIYIEITKAEEDEVYLVKISSSCKNAEMLLENELMHLENYFEFAKPNFSF